MDYKTKINGIARRLRCAIILLPTVVLAQQCVLQSKTVSQVQASIDERSQVQAQVVPEPGGLQRCMVTMRGRVGLTWFTGFGDHTFGSNVDPTLACVAAQRKAEAMILDQVGNRNVASDNTLVCKEDPTLDTLKAAEVGTNGELAQFRPHPDYRKEFRYNGTKCRWFLESGWTGKDVRTGQGIICQIRDSKWVVVDKF